MPTFPVEVIGGPERFNTLILSCPVMEVEVEEEAAVEATPLSESFSDEPSGVCFRFVPDVLEADANDDNDVVV